MSRGGYKRPSVTTPPSTIGSERKWLNASSGTSERCMTPRVTPNGRMSFRRRDDQCSRCGTSKSRLRSRIEEDMREHRSGSQILFGFLPEQTVDLSGRVWRVVQWKNPELVGVDPDSF